MYLNQNYYWTGTGPKPTAHITRGKNRLKDYGNGTVYLRDGSNFEIELYNPTQASVLAHISLNGVQVSAGGIIVKPGQRVFLERFIDEDRKFEFSTYWVGKTKQDQQAIEKNGLVEVSFSEEVRSGNWGPYWGGLSTVIGNGTSITTGSPSWTTANYLFNQPSSLTTGVSSMLFDSVTNTAYTSAPSPKRTETGRVEKGEKSDQVLETAHGNFYDLVTASYTFKILPESQKVVEAGEIRSYCHGCGTRVKKSSWKFCPSCGTQIDG